MKFACYVILLVILGTIAPAMADETDQEDRNDAWQSLFNGRDLDGWYTYLHGQGRDKDPQGIFQVHDGVIHIYKDLAGGGAAPKGYFATKAEYANYHLRFQYKWGDKEFAPRLNVVKDSGCLYHFVGEDVVWPRSIECQVQEGDTGDCITILGAVLETTIDPKNAIGYRTQYLPASEGGVMMSRGGKDNTYIVKHGTHEVDGWNTVDVIVRGKQGSVHMVNGHENFRAKNLQQLGEDGESRVPLDHGRILFQAEFAEVYYRNIKIRPLAGGPMLAPAVETAKE